MKKSIKVAFGLTDGKLNVLDSSLIQTKTLSAHTQAINRVIYVNGYILTASSDYTVKIWEINNNWNLYGTYTGHSASVNALISISNTVMLSGSSDGQMRQWTLNSGTFSTTDLLYTTAGTAVYSVCYLSSLNKIAAGLNNGYIELKTKGSNIVTGNLYQYTSNGVTYGHTPGTSISDLVVVSDTNGYMASAGGDQKVIIWDVPNYLVKYTLTGHTLGVYGLRFLSTSNYLASGAGLVVRLWDTTSGAFVRSFTSDDDVMGFDFLSSSILVVGCFDSSVKTFSVTSGSTLLTGNAAGRVRSGVVIPGETKKIISIIINISSVQL